MIDGIPNHMHEWIAQLLYDGAIHLRLLSRNDKLDLLLNAGGEVAHKAVHFLKSGLDGDHAEGHSDFLKFQCDLA